jgi:hypothetical protein
VPGAHLLVEDRAGELGARRWSCEAPPVSTTRRPATAVEADWLPAAARTMLERLLEARRG